MSDGVMQQPEFRRFLLARTLSGAGNIVTLIALPVLVYRTSGSASTTALVAACEAVPYLLFGLVAGALTDRWDRQRTMVGADLLSALVVASLPVAHLLGHVTLGHVLAVAFLGPTLAVFFDGGSFGALPLLVGREGIAAANSVVYGVLSATEIVAPALVGVLLAVLDPVDLLAFDAVTFLASALLLGSLTTRFRDPDRVHPPLSLRQIGRDIGEGVDYLIHHGGVRTMTIIGTLQCLAAGAFVALMVVWIDRHLGVGTQGLRFGLVYGAWAVGGVLASLLLPRLLRRLTPARVALYGLPLSAAAGIATPLLAPWWLASIGLIVWSVAYSVVVINSISYRQQVTPEHLLGRVNVAGRMLSFGLGWTGGTLVAGLLVGLLGTVPTMVVMAGAGALAVIVVWTSPLRTEPRSTVALVTAP